MKPVTTAEQALLMSAPKYAALVIYACVWLWCLAQYVLLDMPANQLAWPWCSVAATLLALAVGGKRIIPVFITLAAAGYTVELVYCGIFGLYSYTQALGPGAVGVPIAIGLAWALLLCYVGQMISPLRLSRTSLAALGAAWMTSIDLLADPLAAGPLNLWIWPEPGPYYGVPLNNFIGWFCISFLLLFFIGRFSWTSRGIKLIGLTLVFSLALGAMRNGMWVLVGISCGLVAVHWVVEHWHPAPRRLLAAPLSPRPEQGS